MDCVGVWFGPSAVASIEAEELVVTEVDRSLFPMCMMEEAEKIHVAKLNH